MALSRCGSNWDDGRAGGEKDARLTAKGRSAREDLYSWRPREIMKGVV